MRLWAAVSDQDTSMETSGLLTVTCKMKFVRNPVKSWRFRTAEIQNRCQYLTCWNETWTFRQMRDNIFISCVQRHQTHSLHSSCYARLTPALYVQHTDMRLIILLMSHTQKTTQHFYFPKCWIFPLKSSSESLPEFWKTNFTFETLHLFLIVKLNFRRWKWDMFHSETRFLSRHFKALEITFFRLCESGPKSSVLTVVVSFRAECNNQRCSCAAGLQPAVVSSEGLRPSAPSRAQVCVRVCVCVSVCDELTRRQVWRVGLYHSSCVSACSHAPCDLTNVHQVGIMMSVNTVGPEQPRQRASMENVKQCQ